MSGKAAGRVYVRVVPDSTKFREELKAKLERIEHGLEVTVGVNVDTSGVNETLKRVRDKVQRTKLPKLSVDASLDKFDEAMRRTRARLAGNPLHMQLEADARKAQAELDKFRAAQGKGPLSVEVRAKIDGAERQIKHLRDEAKRQKAQFELKAHLDAKAARAELAAAARTRFVNLVVKVNKPALASAAAVIGRLSGGRAVSDSLQSIGTYLANLDKHVPKLAAISLAVANIGAAALASTAGALSLAAGLSQTVGAAVVLPAVLAGGVVSIATFALAMKDAKDRLSELKKPLQDFQKGISGKFWAQAEKPIQDLVTTLLPRLRAGMGQVARELGGFTAEFAGSLQGALSSGVVGKLTGNLAKSIRIASQAVDPLVQAFTTLGLVGSTFLPRLANGFVSLSQRFFDFIDRAAADGSLKRWAEGGLTALKTLASIAGSVGSILGGLFRAAQSAGGGKGLTAFAGNLRAIASIINGPAFQGALTTLFRGALSAMSGLGKALQPIGKLVETLAPALAKVMATAGQAVGGFLASLAGALSGPGFAKGLTDLFSGIAEGLKAIGPALPAVAAALGAIGSVAGTVAANLGGVLGAALQALAPVVVTLLTSIQPLIPILGAALVQAITTLAPVLLQLAQAIGPQLAPLITQLVPLITQLSTQFATSLQALIPLVPALLQLVGAAASLLSALVALGDGAAPVLSALATGISALVGITAGMYQGVAGMLSALLAVFQGNFGALRGIVEDTSQRMLETVDGATGGMMSRFVTFTGDVVQRVSEGFGRLVAAVGEAVGRAVQAVAELPGRARDALGDLSKALFGAGSDLVSGFISGISSKIGDAASKAAEMANAAVIAAKAALDIHSPSKVFKQIGRYVGDGLVQGLDGSKSQIQAAGRRLRGYIEDAMDAKGGLRDSTGKKLISASKSTEKQLLQIVASREALAKKIGDATKKLKDAVKLRDDYAAQIRASVNDLGNVTSFSDSAGGSDPQWIIAGLKDAVAKATQFGQLIQRLKAAGLSNTALKQIADKGVEGGLNVAQALLSGGKSAINQVNQLQGQLDKAGTKLGTITSNAFYGAGVNAANALLKGLQAGSKFLDQAAKSLADRLVAAVKKALKIHSPSAVFRDDIGAMIPAGMAKGISSGQGAVDRALTNMIDISRYQVAPVSAYGLQDLAGAASGPPAVNKYLEGATFYGYTPKQIVDEVEQQQAINYILYGG